MFFYILILLSTGFNGPLLLTHLTNSSIFQIAFQNYEIPRSHLNILSSSYPQIFLSLLTLPQHILSETNVKRFRKWYWATWIAPGHFRSPSSGFLATSFILIAFALPPYYTQTCKMIWSVDGEVWTLLKCKQKNSTTKCVQNFVEKLFGANSYVFKFYDSFPCKTTQANY